MAVTVTQTIVRMPLANLELTPMDGDHNPEALKTSLTQYYPDLRDSTYTVTFENNGATKVVTFTKRTGEKG